MRRIGGWILALWMGLMPGWLWAQRVEEVALEADWGVLRGSLWLPDAATDTAILWVAGSGPTDRYGNSQGGIRTDAYRMVAEQLAQSGYAVLSYDKRGIAASYYRDPQQLMADCRFTYFVDDAARWVDFLYERGYERVVIAGHSEGALIALLVAEANDRIAGVISLCGTSMSMDRVLKLQLGAQLMTTDYALYAAACRVIDTLKRGEEPSEVPQALRNLFPAYLNRFYSEEMAQDPSQVIRRVSAPILLIGGGHDGQVPADQARALKSASPKAELIIVESMCHVLKDSDKRTAKEQLDAYMDPSLPLSAPLVPAMRNFLDRL